MGHEHSHSHGHNHTITSLNKAFIVGIVLNLVFVLVEFGAGFYFDSLALLSDAGRSAALQRRIVPLHTLLQVRTMQSFMDWKKLWQKKNLM